MGLVLRKETADITRHKLKPEYKNLLMAIQALPGVHVQSTTLDKSFDRMKVGWNGLLIFLHIEECCQEGLFFLTRCLDKRYWEYGNKWRIELEVGDVEYPNGDRPLTYYIFRPFQDDDDCEQFLLDECKSLIDNMMHHFNLDNFMTYYNMNKDEFHLVDDVAFHRREKLEDLGL